MYGQLDQGPKNMKDESQPTLLQTVTIVSKWSLWKWYLNYFYCRGKKL